MQRDIACREVWRREYPIDDQLQRAGAMQVRIDCRRGGGRNVVRQVVGELIEDWPAARRVEIHAQHDGAPFDEREKPIERVGLEVAWAPVRRPGECVVAISSVKPSNAMAAEARTNRIVATRVSGVRRSRTMLPSPPPA